VSRGFGKADKAARKRRKATSRLSGAVLAVRKGASVEEAASAAGISKARLEKTLRIDGKQLEEGDQVTEQNRGSIYNSEPTRMPGQDDGVDYGSQEMESLVGGRMATLAASGRPADRTYVIRELVNGGQIKTELGGDYEAELVAALPPKYREQEQVPSQAAGRTLAEATALVEAEVMAVMGRVAAEQGGRVVALGSESGVRRLLDLIEGKARERNISKVQALALVWAEEGADQNRHSVQDWAAATQILVGRA